MEADTNKLQTDTKVKQTKNLNFQHALTCLKNGQTVQRSGWNNTKIVAKLQVPDANSKMTEPYIYMEKYRGDTLVRFPLDLSCESILAEDWQIVD